MLAGQFWARCGGPARCGAGCKDEHCKDKQARQRPLSAAQFAPSRKSQRRRTASLESEGPWSELIAEPTGAGNPVLRLHYTQVVKAVESLPEAQRVVMVLVAVEGMSYRETAEILAVPIGTVMSRLARARLAVGQKFLDRPSGREDDKERHHDRR